MRLFTVVILGLVFSFPCMGQMEFDSIIKQYQSHQSQRMDTLIKLIKEKTGTAWLNLLPSVNYDVDRSSVNVGISLSNFSNYYQQKLRNGIEIEKLKVTMQNQLDNELIRLENEYLKLIFERQSLETEINSLKLKTELFELKRSQFENNKINLESFLKIKETYHNTLLKLEGNLDGLVLRIINFQNKIKSQKKLCLESEVLALKEKIELLKSNTEPKENEE
ncbi:hypothetical protein UMM65_17425 [Aureibaculum sp. 2210JD6-5]|uniref:hypothetical protein n=1 Tax=Aureibaculum sp. 2210JD6-5 TaxID=3103957 RepID=UPI002AAEC5E5|nr:hypothetical protein [Aureibaculum sp. 2210JD6-5]MDY7397026.1 hypothetical protein [Aureibaculum sp. 2210JD6-5]